MSAKKINFISSSLGLNALRIGACSLALSAFSHALTYTWLGGTGNWNAVNWNNGTSTVAGPTAIGNSAIINSGTITFVGNDTFGNGGSTTSSVLVTINQGATLVGAGTTNPIVNLTMNGGTLLANGGYSALYPVFRLSGTLTVGGSAVSTIAVGTGVNNHIGIGNGTVKDLTVAVANATGDANPDLIINNQLGGDAWGGNPHGIIKTGVGTLRLNGANAFDGQLSVQAGTLAIGTINNASAAGALGNSALAVSLGNTGSVTGTLQYTGATASSTKKFTMATGGTGAFQIDNSGTNLSLSGVIDGSGNLSKTGAGTLTLSAGTTHSYSGTTKVTGGTLVVDGNISTSSLTTIGNGTDSATLQGSGTVGALTISTNAFHNPGNSPGIQNVGNYTMAGTLTTEINGLTPGGITGHDQVNVTGTVNLSGNLVAAFGGGSYSNGDLIFILLNDSDDTITGTFSGLAQGATVTTYGGYDWQISYVANSGVTPAFTGGNDVALKAVSIIPEPAAALLGGLGLLTLLRRRRA